MFEFFSYSSRDVIDELKPHAILLRHAHMGTEHLLLGITKSNAPLAQLMGVTYTQVLTSITETIGYGSPPQSVIGWRPFTPELTRVIEESLCVMRAHRHFPLTPLHLLQSMLAQDSAPTRVYLRHAGADVDELLRRLE
ncbi:MAG: Clp protease N-terminal domain-containing protein, partial [Candidatus Saccharimonadales bacterium]